MSNFSIHNDGFVRFYPFQIEDTANNFSGSGVTASVFMATNTLLAKQPIVSIDAGKAKGTPGQFQIILKGDRNWKKLLQPGCWCEIHMAPYQLTGNETAQDPSIRMIGIVKSIRRHETTAHNGKRTVSFMVSGMDHQAVFNTQVYINSSLLQGVETAISTALMLAATGGSVQVQDKSGNKFFATPTPDIVVKTFVDFYLGKLPTNILNPSQQLDSSQAQNSAVIGRPFLVPDALSTSILGQPAPEMLFTRMVTFMLQQNLLGINLNIPQISGQAPVWGLMTQNANLLMNELYSDLLPVNFGGKPRWVPSVVLRPLPFTFGQPNKPDPSCIRFLDAVDYQPNSPTNLTVPQASFYISKHIQESDLLGDLDIGKSDSERFNFFLITPNVQGVDNTNFGLAIQGYAKLLQESLEKGYQGQALNFMADGASGSRYGLCPYIADTNFYFKSGDVITMNAIMRDMWQRVYLYENGTVNLRGTDTPIPVGTNVVFDQRGWVGHVERWQHSFKVSSDGKQKTYRTALTLVHVQNDDGSAIDATGESQANDLGSQIAPWDRGASFTSHEED